MGTQGKRGPYAKGLERRKAILAAALEAYAESDAGGPTLKAIADRAGIPETSLLHYFGSREELFVAIVTARDEADRAFIGDRASDAADLAEHHKIVTHNIQTPGLVKLFAEQSVAAASPSHPAHEYFSRRYPRYIEALSRSLRDNRGLDEATARWFARILIAAADGLQIQWLLDPSIDMDADLARLTTALLGPA
ncbi:TetR/AcrR family transcriptional regulator [Dactylosporangium sp. CA-092794]|uniref:TetR/AcrR family transcriptional regulator n=1 Tax=Dactylosporangium sp. CA-092794 TaxID=3239929 RepID=UPI003D8ECCE7